MGRDEELFATAMGMFAANVVARHLVDEEDALRAATREARDRKWAEDHRERIDAFAEWLDEHGMPFEDLRVF